MPDLTTEHAWACETTRSWTTPVSASSSDDGYYTVTWGRLYDPKRCSEYGYTCTCPGFVYHGSCRHVRELEERDITGDKDLSKHRCGWDSQWEAGEPGQVDGERVCPVCGAPVFSYAYGA